MRRGERFAVGGFLAVWAVAVICALAVWIGAAVLVWKLVAAL